MADQILIPAVEKIGEHVVARIGRQLCYLFSHDKNVENLKNQIVKLGEIQKGVQELIDVAKRNGEGILTNVQSWMERVENIKVDAEIFLRDDVKVSKNCFTRWSLDLASPYKISKEAEKKATEVIELQRDGKFSDISFPIPPSGIESMSTRDFMVFESTKLATMKIMEALKNDKINLIGLYGMGGVGKTTLVKKIGKNVKEEKLFDEVVMAVVSQTPDIGKIQDQLAEMLGMKLNEKSDPGRAGRLCARLKDVKRILIILDDIWAKLDLDTLGIPFGDDHKACKVVLTTRRQQVCSVMGVSQENAICLNILSDQESWDLFRRNTGDFVDSPTLNAMAKEVAKECRGLPVALVTVGRAMKYNKDVEDWEEAKQELKKSMPTNIEGVDRDVYRCLKLSYDYLSDGEAKWFLLFCCLFPEDHDIVIEDLVRYGMGLGIFENVDTVEGARLKARTVVKNLISSCLLLDSGTNGCVKLHDVVRDVGISIASNKFLVRAGVNLKEWPKMESFECYTSISLMYNNIAMVPNALECPNLETLLLQNFGKLCEFPECFFRGMKQLKVLDLSYKYQLRPSFCFLTNLRTLSLEGNGLKDISGIGELRKLEILILRSCPTSGLPEELGQLTNLRVLDLELCQGSPTLEHNVLSRLSRLEELYVAFSGVLWSTAGMHELKSLSRLNVLSLAIEDPRVIPQDFHIPNLTRFDIYIGLYSISSFRIRLFEVLYHRAGFFPLSNTLTLRGNDIPMGSIKFLLEKAENLCMSYFSHLENILPKLDGAGLIILRALELQSCDNLEYLIDASEWIPQLAFSNLEELVLLGLRNFKQICNGVLPEKSFWRLKVLRVGSCNQLINILPYDLMQRLHKLEILEVSHCGEALEELFNFDSVLAEDGNMQLFSNLRELTLTSLRILKRIWKGPTQLSHLHNLRVVSVSLCISLKTLFQPALARTFTQLEEVNISQCDSLEEIIAQNEVEVEAVERILFPKLESLKLEYLPNLRSFCSGSFAFEFPSLKVVVVRKCPKMKTFAATAVGVQNAPKLKMLRVDGDEKLLDGIDLNTAIANNFKEKELAGA